LDQQPRTPPRFDRARRGCFHGFLSRYSLLAGLLDRSANFVGDSLLLMARGFHDALA
jgi:hypothetical protein